MKRSLLLLLSLVIIVGLFSGCAGDKATTTTATTAPTLKADSNFNATGYPIAKEPVTFSVLASNSSAQADDWNNYTAQKYWSDYTNVYFTFEYITSTDWATQINLKLSAGDIPDMIKSAMDTSIIQTHGVEGGKFFDYSQYYEDYMPNMTKAFAKYPDMKAFGTMMDGGVYQLVQNIWTYTMANPIYYRDDMMREMGASIPKTIDEFYDLLVQAKDFYSGVDGYYPLISDITWLHQNIFPAFGKAWQQPFGDNGDGKVSYSLISDQWKLYLEFVAKLYSDKLIDQEIFTMDAATINAKIKAGQCLFIGNNGTQLTKDYYESGKVETKILAPLISEYDSEQKVVNISSYGWCGVVINDKCESPEYLMRYFDMFYTEPDEVFDGICGLSSWLGIKGVDWELTEDGNNYYRILPDDTFGLSEEEYKNKYVYGGGYTGLVILDKFPINNPTQEMKAYESAASYYPYMKPRMLDAQFKYTEEENAELASLITDITTYANTATAQFINGTMQITDANWDKYINDLKQMSIERILEIKQIGYDRWNEALGG
ncbi:MAG: extracellular solute-binding protein [Bacillota bacterium]|nr:extracellular solute-binding protein [Bacillota bacterium]